MWLGFRAPATSPTSSGVSKMGTYLLGMRFEQGEEGAGMEVRGRMGAGLRVRRVRVVG